MSYNNTQKALIQQLLTIVNPDDVAFENKRYKPDKKQLWYAAWFIPATSEITGKTAQSCDEQRGIFQVSIYIPVNLDDYDNTALEAIDTVLGAFTYNTRTEYNGQKVDILESTVNNGSEFESWYKRDISINYLTFSERV